MIICEFLPIGNNMAQCQRCGATIEIFDDLDHFPAFPCGSVMYDIFKNGMVSIQDIKNEILNQPQSQTESECSEQEIQNRFDICKSCDSFDNNTCKECGCILSRDKTFLNKLLWKNQSCPKNKW